MILFRKITAGVFHYTREKGKWESIGLVLRVMKFGNPQDDEE